MALRQLEPLPRSPDGQAIALTQPRLFGLKVLGEGGWLKTLRMADYAPRKARPGSLQQSLFPYHEAWG